MAVPFARAHRVEGVDAIVGVQVEQEAFETGHLAVLGFVDFG